MRYLVTEARVLAFGLWAGVMVGFAFLFAPIAFAAIGPTPVFAAMIARTINAITLFGYGCAAAAVLASLADRMRIRAAGLAAIAVIMVLLSFYETHAVVPLMQHTRLQTPLYEALHRRSSGIYGATLLLGIVGLLWSAAGQPSRPHPRRRTRDGKHAGKSANDVENVASRKSAQAAVD